MRRSWRRAASVLLACTFAAPLSLSSSPASSAPPSDPQEADCRAQGGRFIRPRVAARPDGGQDRVFTLAQGETNLPVPPRDLDPDVASDAQLAHYALPARVTGEGHDAWAADVRMLIGATQPAASLCTGVQRATPKPAIKFSGPIATADLLPPANTVKTPNWSGYVAKGTNNYYDIVQGDYLQPAVAGTACASAVTVHWTGLGGYDSARLIQTGTIEYADPVRYYAWFDYGKSYPFPALTYFTGVTVRPGDQIHTIVHYDQATQKFDMRVTNVTLNQSQVAVRGPDASYYDGNAAEWIDERPGVDGSNTMNYYNLLNYQRTDWFASNARLRQGGAYVSIASQVYDRVIMRNNADTKTLSRPTTLPSADNKFTDAFLACA